MKTWLFWSHSLAFVLGGVRTLAVLIVIGNVEAQRLYDQAEANQKVAQSRHQDARLAAELLRALDKKQ